MINWHRRWVLHRSSQHPFHREWRKSPEIALYQVHLHTCHCASSLFAWSWSSLDHRSLAQHMFILFLQLLLYTNSCQLSLRIMTPDFSRACHVTLARMFLWGYMKLDTLSSIIYSWYYVMSLKNMWEGYNLFLSVLHRDEPGTSTLVLEVLDGAFKHLIEAHVVVFNTKISWQPYSLRQIVCIVLFSSRLWVYWYELFSVLSTCENDKILMKCQAIMWKIGILGMCIWMT